VSIPNQPQLLTPSQPGQLANGNGTSVAIPLSVLSTNPNVASTPGAIRVQAQRNAISGQPVAPYTVWDTLWVGGPATATIPAEFVPPSGSGATTLEIGANGVQYYNGFVYALCGTSGSYSSMWSGWVISAPASGASIGNWTQQQNLTPVNVYDHCDPGALVILDIAGTGYIYALSTQAIQWATINADGSLTPFSVWELTTSGVGNTMTGVSLLPLLTAQNSPSTGSGAVGWLVVNNCLSGPSGQTLVFAVGAGGVFTGNFTSGAGPVTGNIAAYGALWLDPTGVVIMIGGENAAGTPSSNIEYASFNFQTGAMGSWATVSSALPAARSRFGLATSGGELNAYWIPGTSGPTVQGVAAELYVIGGVATSGGASQTTVYYGVASSLSTWHTGTALGTAAKLCGACYLPVGQQWSGTTYESLVVPAGGSSGFIPQVTSAPDQNSTSWKSGATTILTATELGSGSVTTNADGSVTLGFDYGWYGQGGGGAGYSVQALNNGDQVQIQVWLTDLQGDVSLAGQTIVKVGQGPSIGSVSPANSASTTGNPSLSWSYIPGAGGAAQYSWDAQIYDGATLVFDSGIVLGNANNISPPSLAPMLASGTAYTFKILVYSQDSPISGSYNYANSSTTFTPSFTAPSVPGTVSATADNSNGLITVEWKNATGSTATYNRLYTSLTGSAPWRLAMDQITAVIGSAQSVQVMDDTPLSNEVYYAVSAVRATPGESALSSVVSATINPGPTGASAQWSVCLHVQGNGPTYHATVLAQGTLTAQEYVDVASQTLMGLGFPVARYGAFDYRLLEIPILIQTTAALESLQAVLAQARNGNVLQYRDGYGAVLSVNMVSPTGNSQGAQPNQLTYSPPVMRNWTLYLVQAPDLSTPYVQQGTTQGFAVLVDGSIPPLAPYEAVS
jgi:hypothetical protein